MTPTGGGVINPVKVGLWQTVAEPEKPTKEGYIFVEWQLDGKAYDFKAPVTKNITLTAKWEIIKLTISFNTIGGTSIAPITIDYGTKIVLPENPIKEDMNFIGWTLDNQIFNKESLITNNIELKALWSADTNTINEVISINANTYIAYKTLDTSLESASENDTIILYKDITITGAINVNKKITLDGNGHTITAQNSTETAIHAINVSAPCSLNNININREDNGKKYSGGIYINNFSSEGTVSIINCNVTFPRALYSGVAMNVTVKVDNSKLEGVYPLNGTWKYLEVKNSELYGWCSYGYDIKQSVYLFDNCTFGKSYAGYAMLKGYNNYIVKDCTFSNDFIHPDNDSSETHFGIATGTTTPITLNFVDSKVIDDSGNIVDITKDIIKEMFNYKETSGSSTGESTINKNYWEINGIQVFGPTTE